MSNNSGPIFEPYAEIDFADAKPMVKVPALAKLQAAHGGKSRVVVRVDNATLINEALRQFAQGQTLVDVLCRALNEARKKTEVVTNCDHLQKLKFSKTS